jgi:chaperonin GroEL (HSP60 family)
MNAINTRLIVSGDPARAIVVKSLAQCERAIGASLGPFGRGLMYDGGSGGPRHASTGLAIARQVAQEEGAWSVAPRILRDALWDAQRELGDGTARIACIAVAMHACAAARVSQGVSPGLLTQALRQLSARLPALLERQHRVSPGALAMAQSACESAEIASTVARMSATLCDEGAISISEGFRPGVEFEQFAGFCMDVKPDRVGGSVKEQGARIEMNEVHVLVVNEILDDFGPLARVLEQFVSRAKSLVVVSRGIEAAARATLTANRAGLSMHVLGLLPSDTGLNAMQVLEDLCAMTGATLISAETGLSIASVRPAMLGRAARLVVQGTRAIFVEPAGERTVIANRRDWLACEAAGQRYVALDRERLLRRTARMGGNWGEMRVAGRTAWETAECVDGASAALAAVRAAPQGVVAGGGQALSKLADALIDDSPLASTSAHEAALEALVHGCRSVAVRLARNAGVEPGELQVPAEVTDPLPTTLAILRHAISVATTLLTIEVLIC